MDFYLLSSFKKLVHTKYLHSYFLYEILLFLLNAMIFTLIFVIYLHIRQFIQVDLIFAFGRHP